eukprot:767416-Hanusia_phi.AAC.1
MVDASEEVEHRRDEGQGKRQSDEVDVDHREARRRERGRNSEGGERRKMRARRRGEEILQRGKHSQREQM